MNKVVLIGNLTKTPENSETPNGTQYCKLSIAVNREYKDTDGYRPVDFFNVMTWRAQAERCARYLKKGNKIAVIGSIQNRSYEDKNGDKRQITEIVADSVEFLTPKSSEPPVNDGEQSYTHTPRHPEQVTLTPVDDDLPF